MNGCGSGTEIADRLCIKEGPGVWAFDDCLVVEYKRGGFDVYMREYDAFGGGIVSQYINADDMVNKRRMLDAGHSPRDGGWEDFAGRSINAGNAELVEGDGDFIFEAGAGEDRFDRIFPDEFLAMDYAERFWAGLSKAHQDDYLKTEGAYFRIVMRNADGSRDVICNCIENARRADQRKTDADRAKKEPGYLREWASDLHGRLGVMKAHECESLFEAGWRGSEVVSRLYSHSLSVEMTNDMMDYLAMLTVRRELRDIMTRMKIAAGSGVWAFDDCVVVEDTPGRYSVFMTRENGDIVCQKVEEDVKFMRGLLNAGHPLTEGRLRGVIWDVYGYNICPESGEIRVALGGNASEMKVLEGVQ